MKSGVSSSVLGSSLLLCGSCIGAGMLALPILTGLTGFFPSLLALVFAWALMSYSALLIVEMNSWFPQKTSLLSMIEKPLGKWGKGLCFISYLSLFYSLLVAYIAMGGKSLARVFPALGPSFDAVFPSLFTLVFGAFIYLGTKVTDLLNRALMAGLFLSFFAMLFLGFKDIEPAHLLHIDWSYFFLSLPVLVLSFGFQNMIPPISDYLHRDWKKMEQTIFLGSFLVFVIYLLWQALLMGIIPYDGETGLLAIYKRKEEASAALRLSNIGFLGSSFAFFAVVTSFLAQALSLLHFLSDDKAEGSEENSRFLLSSMTLFPPLIFSLTYPGIFYAALRFAGGISAMLLFGLLPVFSIWKLRYEGKAENSYQAPGGKPALIAAGASSFFLFFREIIVSLQGLL